MANQGIDTQEKTLIIAPNWIGDCVMSHALVRRLQSQGHTTIDVLARHQVADVFRFMPGVNKVLSTPKLKFPHPSFIKSVRLIRKRYTSVYVLRQTFKVGLLAKLSQAKERVGYAKHAMVRSMLTRAYEAPPEGWDLRVEAYAYLASDKRPSISEIRPKLGAPNVSTPFAMRTDRPQLGIFPGAAYGPAKRWSADAFAELALQKTRDKWDVHIFGGPKETKLAKIIKRRAPYAINHVGKCTLIESMQLIAGLSFAVGNDSGLSHIASAYDVPCVVLFGSTSPKLAPPLSEGSKVVYKKTICSPCDDRVCRYGHHDCMENITPSEVASLLDDMEAELF